MWQVRVPPRRNLTLSHDRLLGSGWEGGGWGTGVGCKFLLFLSCVGDGGILITISLDWTGQAGVGHDLKELGHKAESHATKKLGRIFFRTLSKMYDKNVPQM